MGHAPNIPTPQTPPPPPTPAMLQPKLAGAKPTLGGTFLTQSMPSAAPLRKPQKTLLGQ